MYNNDKGRYQSGANKKGFEPKHSYEKSRNTDAPQGAEPQKSYGQNKTGEYKKSYEPRKSYEKGRSFDSKKPFEKKPYDSNKPYEKKPYDSKKPFEKKPYDSRKPYDRDKRFEDKRNDEPQSSFVAETEPELVTEDGASIVYGRNSVLELLKSGRAIDKAFVRRGDREGSITVIVAECLSRKIPVIEVEKTKLDALSGNGHHQGVVIAAAMKEYSTIDAMLAIAAERGEKPLIIIADEIEDPHNLGAIIRCAEGAGAHGLIIPKRRSAGLSSAVDKASAGALEHLAIAKVPNIAAAIAELKDKGLWIYGAESGGQPFYETKFDSATALVVGSEGAGISRLVREKCDYMVSIPMYGNVNSFNVSCAAAVILCEAARQLRKGN